MDERFVNDAAKTIVLHGKINHVENRAGLDCFGNSHSFFTSYLLVPQCFIASLSARFSGAYKLSSHKLLPTQR
jgi:hypothetical protein